MELAERLPSPNEYVGLRRTVGWPSPTVEECKQALQGSLAAVCLLDDGEIVGMGRLVGDGAMYCFAVDVVVDPRHQRRGMGRAIMERLQAIAQQRRLSVRLDLVAAPDVASFYRRLGFDTLDSALMRKSL